MVETADRERVYWLDSDAKRDGFHDLAHQHAPITTDANSFQQHCKEGNQSGKCLIGSFKMLQADFTIFM